MILQPLAENAVKHGASLAQGVGKITIVAVMVDDVLRVEVRDNGPGFAAGFRLHEGGAGHGLWNAAERLRGYYGAEGVLKWQTDGN